MGSVVGISFPRGVWWVIESENSCVGGYGSLRDLIGLYVMNGDYLSPVQS